jgi:hypothetical protein
MWIENKETGTTQRWKWVERGGRPRNKEDQTKSCENCGATMSKKELNISTTSWSVRRFCSRKCFKSWIELKTKKSRSPR